MSLRFQTNKVYRNYAKEFAENLLFAESLMASNVANLSETMMDGRGLQAVEMDREEANTCPEDERCLPVCPVILKILDILIEQ